MKRLLFIFAALLIASSLNAQNKGYEKSVEIFGGAGINALTKYQVGISMINGYRFNDYIYAGVGAGFRFQEARYMYTTGGKYSSTHDSREPRYIIPIYARIKANLTQTSVSPFLIADIGGNIDVGLVEYKNIQGFFIEPQFGLDLKLKEPIAPYFALGVNIASSKYHYFNFDTAYQGERTGMATSLVFHVGIKF